MEKYSKQIDNTRREITIERYFQYKNAEFKKAGYRIYTSPKIKDESIKANEVATALIKRSPLIQYYEDFKDQIPEYISIKPGSQYYNDEWYSVIKGLFYHADKNYNVEHYLKLKDENMRTTILNRVNQALNKQFTSNWNRRLKGGKNAISNANLVYDGTKNYLDLQ